MKIVNLALLGTVLWACGDSGSSTGGNDEGGAGGGSPTVGGAGGEGASGAMGSGATGAGASGAGGDGAGGEGAMGGAGGGEPEPPNCEPVANGVIDASCGVFVKADAAPGGDGSKAAPFASLEAATAGGASPIYVCLEPLTQPQHITNPAIVYGGVDCTNFSWTAAERSQIATCQPGVAGCASDITVPLTIEEVGTLTIERLDVFAPNAIVAGQSSIAIVAMEATITLRESTVVAGNGAPGAMGGSGLQGEAGANGANGVLNGNGSLLGPDGAASACGVFGGDGGGYFILNGNDFSAPTQGGVAQGNAGLNGTLGMTTSACAGGGMGVTIGQVGPAGANAAGQGALSTSGYEGVAGSVGGVGAAGGGGGGGGSLRWIQAGVDPIASGGAGGAGGCGGLGGLGGGFGGSSFAILSLGSTLVFDAVSLQSALGADGAVGGAGGPGGAGGLGGTGGYNFNGGINSATACSGGAGRPGGAGGPGGAGAGGHSAAIAHLGPAPNLSGATTSVGTAGVGPGSAADGLAVAALAF
jgi:hypothetical protein